MAKKFVRFACPNCQKRLKATQPSEVGKTTRCPHCGCRITVPVLASAGSGQDPEGAKSTIQMAAYEGRETDHLPSQPATNPLIYALGGALLVLLLGGGMFAAYTLGRGELVAAGGQPAGTTEDKASTAAPENPPTSPAETGPQPGTPSPSQNSPVARSTNPVTSNPSATKPTATKPTPTPTSPFAPRPSSTDNSSEPEKNFDDSNRPTVEPFELVQPQATGKKRDANTVTTVFVEVPVLVPSTFGQVSPSKSKVVPDLSVIIRPEDVLTKVMKVDRRSPPGLATKMTISLDKTPKTEVKITVKPDAGLVVDQTAIKFSANVAPIEQVISISGDGTAAMPLGPSKVFYVNVTATGGGLTSKNAAKIPVQVQRRNSFQMSNGIAINRSDFTNPSNPSPVLSNWTFRNISGSPVLVGEQYTAEYVQLRGPRRRFRLYEDRIEFEQPTGSGNYQSRVTGSWK